MCCDSDSLRVDEIRNCFYIILTAGTCRKGRACPVVMNGNLVGEFWFTIHFWKIMIWSSFHIVRLMNDWQKVPDPLVYTNSVRAIQLILIGIKLPFVYVLKCYCFQE